MLGDYSQTLMDTRPVDRVCVSVWRLCWQLYQRGELANAAGDVIVASTESMPDLRRPLAVLSRESPYSWVDPSEGKVSILPRTDSSGLSDH